MQESKIKHLEYGDKICHRFPQINPFSGACVNLVLAPFGRGVGLECTVSKIFTISYTRSCRKKNGRRNVESLKEKARGTRKIAKPKVPESFF